jgi:hypothetical protein
MVAVGTARGGPCHKPSMGKPTQWHELSQTAKKLRGYAQILRITSMARPVRVYDKALSFDESAIDS